VPISHSVRFQALGINGVKSPTSRSEKLIG
jgi:hypothetical protein